MSNRINFRVKMVFLKACLGLNPVLSGKEHAEASCLFGKKAAAGQIKTYWALGFAEKTSWVLPRFARSSVQFRCFLANMYLFLPP